MHRIILFLLSASSTLGIKDEIFKFIEEPESTVAIRGSRVTLRCSTNFPAERITWYFNDVLLTSESGSNRRRRNKEGPETIDPSYEEEFDAFPSSEYRRSNLVRLSNPKTVRRRKEHDRHRKRKREKHLDHGLGNRYVRSDERARSSNAKTYGIQVRDGRLSIQSLKDENQGFYHCVAVTASGSIRSTSANVRIAYISNFSFVPPRRVTAKSSAVVLPCRLPESTPPARPRWKVNNTWIEKSSGPYMVLPSGGLFIKNVTSLSGLEFRCGAANAITNEVKSTPSPTTLLVDGTEDEALSDIIYPTSNQVINATAEVGQQLLMECVSGDLSKFVWTRDKGDLPDVAEVTEAGLLVTVATSDSGLYTCESSTASKTVVYNLVVSEKPSVVPASPNRVTLTEDVGITTLKCTVDSGEEGKLRWYYNGENMVDAEGPELNVTSKTAGFYQCFAKNRYGAAYATFLVEESNDDNSGPEFTTSEEYFTAKADPSGVAMPKIAQSRTPTQPTSHTLTWTTTDSVINVFSIKFYKEPYVDSFGTVVQYPWKVVNVPGEEREVVLDNLEPSSTYTVEMVAVSEAGTRSEVVISSFSTGRELVPNRSTNRRPGAYPPNSNSDKSGKPRGKKDDGPKKNKNGKVPKAPSRPGVIRISVHEASLMWSARGNGGSPILGYKIQRKVLDEKSGWETVGESKTQPFQVGNLQRGKFYRFRVIAYSAVGDSQPSSASKQYPKKRRRLEYPPYIVQATSQGPTSILISWQYEGVPVSSIGGYYIYHRPTDSDDEEDYVREILENPVATSYVIRNLEPDMQYDVKIQAFNDLGKSRYSNVIILEMPKPGDSDGKVIVRSGSRDSTETFDEPGEPDRNDIAREKAYERNTIFLITGAVIGVILIILLLTVFCYWRSRGRQNAQPTPELKLKNGMAGGFSQGRPSNHINMTKISSNGHATPNESGSPRHYGHSPHDTRCQCSRHHSNHSSLGREVDYPPYDTAMPPGQGYPGNWTPGHYPNIHSNPLHMYAEYRYPYFPHQGIGRGGAVTGGPPSWWVRGNNGEFCHIIPGEDRKMSGDGGQNAPGQFPVQGGHMVTRTYDGNVRTADYDESVHRPDNGYHSNEDGTRTGSDSQADKSDDTVNDDDANSADAATSGVVTLNEVAIESRPSSSEAKEDDESGARIVGTSCDIEEMEERDETENKEKSLKICGANVNENTPFLSPDENERKETVIT